jgi:hypothetical protein
VVSLSLDFPPITYTRSSSSPFLLHAPPISSSSTWLSHPISDLISLVLFSQNKEIRLKINYASVIALLSVCLYVYPLPINFLNYSSRNLVRILWQLSRCQRSASEIPRKTACLCICPRPLLDNGSVNTFLQQRQKNCWTRDFRSMSYQMRVCGTVCVSLNRC